MHQTASGVSQGEYRSLWHLTKQPVRLYRLPYKTRFRTLRRKRRQLTVKNKNVVQEQAREMGHSRHANRSGASSKGKTAVLWFRNDLRLHDHAVLAAAQNAAPFLLPIYIFDPRTFQRNQSGFGGTGPFKARFLLECVQDLRSRLENLGSKLFIRIGRPEEILPSLTKRIGASIVFCQEEVGQHGLKTQKAVAKGLMNVGVRLQTMWTSTLHSIEDLPFNLRDVSADFGAFYKSLESVPVRDPTDTPKRLNKPPPAYLKEKRLPTLKDLGFSDQEISNLSQSPDVHDTEITGGESAALGKLKLFHMPHHVSLFSAWLSVGCLSPRFFFYTFKHTHPQMGNRTKVSRNAYLLELLWHDFYRFRGREFEAQPVSIIRYAEQSCS